MTQKSLTETNPSTKKQKTIDTTTQPNVIKDDITPPPKILTIPEETKILLDMLEAIEGIIYAGRQQICQLYGPIDYQQQKRPTNPTEIEQKFTEETANRLTFTSEGENWIIKPKQFLGAENFAKIAAIVRTLGGEYIPANKQAHIEGHFKVRKR